MLGKEGKKIPDAVADPEVRRKIGFHVWEDEHGTIYAASTEPALSFEFSRVNYRIVYKRVLFHCVVEGDICVSKTYGM